MKVEVQRVNGCRRRIQVEVPEETVRAELDLAARRMSRTVQLPGFRKGRAPFSLVRKQLGKELQREVVSKLIRECTERVLEDKDLRPIHNPVLEGYTFREGSPLRFRAVFDVLPEIRLGRYLGLLLEGPDLTVKRETVEEALRDLQGRAARYHPVEGRPVREGDLVVGALAGKYQDGAGGEIPERTVTLEVGEPEALPGFREALPGMEIGQERTFPVAFPDDHPDSSLAGRRIEYRFRLREIKQRELPPLDDDLAREIGSFETLRELEEAVRKQLREAAEKGWKRFARQAILEQLLGSHDLDLPASLVEEETRSRVEASLGRGDLPPGGPSRSPSIWKEEWERQRPLAERGVKATLLLDAIGKREGISARVEEINERLRSEAERRGRTVSSLKEEVSQEGGWNELERAVVREKVLDFLLENANISKEGPPK